MALHYEQSLQNDIERIRKKLTEMAGLCDFALHQCLKALVERDRQSAYAVILRDQYIDEMEKQLDRLCLEFLVRQQPVASPLRFVYGTIRINLELERVGDYAESIARQTLKLLSMDVQFPVERFVELAELSIPMINDAIRAFVTQDVELARKTIETEDAVDVLKSKLNKDLVAMFRESKLPFEALNPLVMIARRFERVSDQARNICMETLYTSTGEPAKHHGAEVIRLLFLDEHNSCRSQMAEAIAHSLGHANFLFSSAGLEPQPVDEATIAFLRSKGIDISRKPSRALNQVPNLDHYHVVVGLAREAKRAFPPQPRKITYIDWSLDDPSKLQGSAEERQAAYERAYQFLDSHIRDLVNAILGQQNKT